MSSPGCPVRPRLSWRAISNARVGDDLSVDTRTAVGDQQRESVLLPGPLVDEIDVEPLDFGDELIKSVEPHEHP